MRNAGIFAALLALCLCLSACAKAPSAPADSPAPAAHSPAETEAPTPSAPPPETPAPTAEGGVRNCEYTDDGDGDMTCFDRDNGLSVSYPLWMTLEESLIDGALVVSDGSGGHVVCRNATELYQDFEGGADAFVTRFADDYILPAFELLYGERGVSRDFVILAEGGAGPGATAELTVSAAGRDIFVKCFLFSSAGPEGGEALLAKTFFCPSGENDQLIYLRDNVKDLAAADRA